ncbi:copper transpport protein [Diatrype stigma]|uniref:Copper transport protein n=1 Tax=Diatrype stigma TaxID=117547 RepID=A0AAN9YNF7_9PEZI
MDHGGHAGHGDMDMGDKCSMNMLFTWDTKNLCIIFPQWHVRGTASLIFSLLAIVAICAGYEALREAARRYEAWTDKQDEISGPRRNQVEVSKRRRLIKSVLYGIQNFYAFMLM